MMWREGNTPIKVQITEERSFQAHRSWCVSEIRNVDDILAADKPNRS